MKIHSFTDLLLTAKQQAQPQRLLFVFAAAELPADATATQRSRFESRQGGNLEPCMCVDKCPNEVIDFTSFRAEAAQFGKSWQVMFVASLAGTEGQSPSNAQVEQHLHRMIESIKQGRLKQYLAFDLQGELLSISFH